MSERKPVPILSARTKRVCPVCGSASYSPSGMHPQCAAARADAIMRAALKAAGTDVKAKVVRKSWYKTCPKCKRQSPARRYVCECGHQFGGMPATGATQSTAKPPSAGVRKPR
jgi:hypothetical protein